MFEYAFLQMANFRRISAGDLEGHFILDLGNDLRRFQQSMDKIPEGWNEAFSSIHKTSRIRMKQPWFPLYLH
jgi:hypothetical protein